MLLMLPFLVLLALAMAIGGVAGLGIGAAIIVTNLSDIVRRELEDTE